jgi:hypothetical protein
MASAILQDLTETVHLRRREDFQSISFTSLLTEGLAWSDFPQVLPETLFLADQWKIPTTGLVV